MATKLEGGGGKALVAGPLKKDVFAAFPISHMSSRIKINSRQSRS